MGAQCACLGQEGQNMQAIEKENQNSKFFYYSDPKLLKDFQDKLQDIKKNFEAQKRYRDSVSKNDVTATSHWNERSRISRKQSSIYNSPGKVPEKMTKQNTLLQSSLSTQAASQLRQIENQLTKENLTVTQNLNIERVSGWNEAVPSRLILEVGRVAGLWNTAQSWFTQCRSLVQIEYAGTCINSKPNVNMADPHFAELFIFPVSEQTRQQLPAVSMTKVFITVFTIEGKSNIPDVGDFDNSMQECQKVDGNVYKRIAEYCLDIGDICSDQLVHKLNLSVPVKSQTPQPGPLFHQLRNCNISGLFNDQLLNQSSILDFKEQSRQDDSSFFSYNEPVSTRLNLKTQESSPPLKKEKHAQQKTLPVYQSPTKKEDFSILDIISEIDEPMWLKETNENEMKGYKTTRQGLGRQESEQLKKNKLVPTSNRNKASKYSPSKPHQQLQVTTAENNVPGGFENNAAKGSKTVRNKRNSLYGPQSIDQNLQQLVQGQASARRRRTGQEKPNQNTMDSEDFFGAGLLPQLAATMSHKQIIKTTRHQNDKNLYHARTGEADAFGDQVDQYSKKVWQPTATDARSITGSNRMQKMKSTTCASTRNKLTGLQQSPELAAYKRSNYLAIETDVAATTRSRQYQTPNDMKRSRRGFHDFTDGKTKCDSPVKVIKCEDALGEPCRSFSFDDDFRLDSDMSNAAIDDNWSPVAMGATKVTLESRVSPLKLYETSNAANSKFNTPQSQLLGGLYPVQAQRKLFETKDAPQAERINLEPQLVTAEEAARAATNESITVELRIQFLNNAQDYLLNYKDQLQKTNQVMRQIDQNRA